MSGLAELASNKPHKKPKKSKTAKKSTDVSQSQKNKNPKAFNVSNVIRTKRTQQRNLDREQKKELVPLDDRSIDDSPPPMMVVVMGPHGVGKSTLIRSLVKLFSGQNIVDIKGPVTVAVGRKRRVTFFECPLDIYSMTDLSKVADLVLLMIDASYGFEMETFEFLNQLQLHGFPKVMGILTHLDKFKANKTLQSTKKMLKHRFWTEIYKGAKMFDFMGTINGKYLKHEVKRLSLYLSRVKFRPLVWRNSHPYIVIDRVEDVTNYIALKNNKEDPNTSNKDVYLFGYVRGTHMKSNMKVHLIGGGDYDISTIVSLPDPCPLAQQTIEKSSMKTLKSAKSKDALLYAPMSNVGRVQMDREGLYIDIKNIHYTKPELLHINDMHNKGDIDNMMIDSNAEPTPIEILRSMQDVKSKSNQINLTYSTEAVKRPSMNSNSDYDLNAMETRIVGNNSSMKENSIMKRVYGTSTGEKISSVSTSIAKKGKENNNNSDDEDDDNDIFGSQENILKNPFQNKVNDKFDINALDSSRVPWKPAKYEVEEYDNNALINASHRQNHVILSSLLSGLMIQDDQNNKIASISNNPNNKDRSTNQLWDLLKLRFNMQIDKELRELNARKKSQFKSDFDNSYDKKKEANQNGGVDEDDDLGMDEDDLDENGGKRNKKGKKSRPHNEEDDMDDPEYLQQLQKVKEMKDVKERNKREFAEDGEHARLTLEGYRQGLYVRVLIKDVTPEFIHNFNPKLPIILGGLLPHEAHSMGYISARVKRHRWHKRVLKSNDPLIFSIGWRRFQSIPVYSIVDQNERERFLKYTPEHMHCNMTFYGPLVAPNTGILAFQKFNRNTADFRISLTGISLEQKSTSSVVKKLKLVGSPFKIYKNTAFISGMFNSALEVAKFEGAKLKTVSGIRGSIKKALHHEGPAGSFRATFEDKIVMSDIVICRLWVPVELKNYYNPVLTLLANSIAKNNDISNDSNNNDGEDNNGDKLRLMRTTAELRKDLKIPQIVNKDSVYKPIERVERVFKSLKIPTKLQAALPFASKPKQMTAKNPESYLTKRAIILEPEERKSRGAISMLGAIAKQKKEKRLQSQTIRLQKRNEEKQRETERFESFHKEEKKRKYRDEGKDRTFKAAKKNRI
eukprot:gene4817-6750_t